MTKGSFNLGVVCGILLVFVVSAYFTMINQESFLRSPEYVQKRDIEMEASRTNSSDFLSRRNDERVNLLRKGCNLDQSIFRESKNMDFDELRKIQVELLATSEKIESGAKLTFVENRKQLYDLFDLKNNDLLTCLPPKTGTTNWQRYFAALLYPEREPESFGTDEIFKVLPRFKTKNEIVDQAKIHSVEMRMINVRHPFARILSAWRQKFGKDFWNLDMYVRKYGKSISKFEEINYENENVFSFRAFLEYIVAVAEINQFDYHWKTMDFECSPCFVDYTIVTKQETSATDAKFVTERAHLQGLTHLPGQYSDSPLLSSGLIDFYRDIPEDIIKKLYKIYFVDFLLFGYSIDEFLTYQKVCFNLSPQVASSRVKRFREELPYWGWFDSSLLCCLGWESDEDDEDYDSDESPDDFEEVYQMLPTISETVA
ncbi:Oidioi.mRNA.OKI2018_I69.PAR.g12741.t1.cds [Oikopleura dioica]|uniref:Carbohydrate sulfotransferase n=1 Tax=Oikopleura dioica TaxID=34765 RepID=A0ABN7S1H1_OIKDI|nr:Oidioi.mRNA.OKI2018_I69.PAR.g12741.t1.cds [Oikopleura dioica]